MVTRKSLGEKPSECGESKEGNGKKKVNEVLDIQKSVLKELNTTTKDAADKGCKKKVR